MPSNLSYLHDKFSFTIPHVVSTLKRIFKYCIVGRIISYFSEYTLRSSLALTSLFTTSKNQEFFDAKALNARSLPCFFSQKNVI